MKSFCLQIGDVLIQNLIFAQEFKDTDNREKLTLIFNCSISQCGYEGLTQLFPNKNNVIHVIELPGVKIINSFYDYTDMISISSQLDIQNKKGFQTTIILAKPIKSS